MKRQILVFALLYLMLWPAACQSNPPLNATQTQNSVTLAIINVDFSEKDTLVTFGVQVGRDWGLDSETFPPQQALHNNAVLSDEAGRQYAANAGTYGLPQPDEATGGVTFENTATFPPMEAGRVSLTVEIEISEIPVSQAIYVSMADHEVSDVWPIGPGITFASFTDVPGEVKLSSLRDDRLELEFTLDRPTSDGLRLGCLNFYPADQDWENDEDTFRECLLSEEQIISKTGMDVPADLTSPIPFHVTGSVVFVKPFSAAWPGEK